MAPIIEVARVELRPEVVDQIKDPDSDARRRWLCMMDLVSQQPGFIGAFWGQFVEDPSTMNLQVAWKDLQDHINLTQTEVFQDRLANLGAIRGPNANVYHAGLDPEKMKDACSQPTTEVLQAYFPPDADHDKIGDAFTQAIGANAKGIAHAWTMEEQEDPEKKGVKGKGKAYLVNSGLSSAEVPKSEGRHALRSKLQSIPGMTNANFEVRHVHFTNVSKA